MSHESAPTIEQSCAEYTRELTQFQLGLLADADAEIAEQHLYACPNCRLLTDQVEAVTALVGDVEPPTVPDGISRLLDDITNGTAAEPSDPGDIARLLLRLAKSLDTDRAEDLVQQTLLAAFEEHSGELDIVALARDIADRAFAEPAPTVRSLDDYRTRAERQSAETAFDDGPAELFYPDFYDFEPDAGRHLDSPNQWGRTDILRPDDEVFTTDLYGVVDGAIEQLDDPLGQLVQLVVVDHVPLMDAARMLRLEQAEAVDALHRARLHLRGVVDKYLSLGNDPAPRAPIRGTVPIAQVAAKKAERKVQSWE